MIILGLTGSIGMGKSTCAEIFARHKIPVHDSDAAVHEALSFDQSCLIAIRTQFPYYEYQDIYGKKNKTGARNINRRALGALVFNDDEEREKLEQILHPYVWESQNAFIKKHQACGTKIILFDIPLLFETGADGRVDKTIVVSAPAHIQRQRVLAREGMTLEKFEAILKRQMPDGEKRTRADYVIETGLGMSLSTMQVKKIIKQLQVGAHL